MRKNRNKITTSINICVSNTHLNIRKIIYIPYQVVAVYAAVLKHVFAGWPGCSADGSILKHSPLSHTQPQLMNNHSEYLTDTYHIVGDKTSPLTQYNLTPYKKSKGRSRTRAQKIYNS